MASSLGWWRCLRQERAALVVPLALAAAFVVCLVSARLGSLATTGQAASAAEAAPLVWISEAGNASKISQKRREHLLLQSAVHRLPLSTIGQVSQGEDGFEITNQLLINKLRVASAACDAWPGSAVGGEQVASQPAAEPLRTSSAADQLVLITEDDVHFHRSFREELGRTLAALPQPWRILHLCPGYLWGRRQALGAHLEPGAMNPEGPVPEAADDRFFRGLSGIVVGGPVAFATRCTHVDGILSSVLSLRSPFQRGRYADVTLLTISSPDDFVAREPQLCTEWPQGGSQLQEESEVWQSYWGLLLRLVLYPLGLLAACVGISAVSDLATQRPQG